MKGHKGTKGHKGRDTKGHKGRDTKGHRDKGTQGERHKGTKGHNTDEDLWCVTDFVFSFLGGVDIS